MIKKIFWVLRGLGYSLFLGKFQFPSYLGKPLFISRLKNIYIGKKVRIFPGARLECLNKQSKIIFEDNISVGQNIHVIASETVEIKKNTTISANVFIADVNHNYQAIDQHIMDQPLTCKKTVIGENCFIGYGAVIDAGTILGKQCVVGANAVVKGSFPDYCVIAGVPATIIKKYNSSSHQWEKQIVKENF